MPKTTRRPTKSAPLKTTSRKPTSKPASRSSARKPRTTAKKQPSLWSRISAERKLDLLGVVLALIGLLTLLALFSTTRGAVTGWWMKALTSIAGWGMFVLPLGLIGFGLWLVFRRIDKFPMLSAGRVFGILSLYINLLSWLHLFTGGGWGKTMTGKGGWLGGFFEYFLEDRFGTPGAVIFLSAWTLISLLVLFDLPLPELVQADCGPVRTQTSGSYSIRHSTSQSDPGQTGHPATGAGRGFQRIAGGLQTADSPPSDWGRPIRRAVWWGRVLSGIWSSLSHSTGCDATQRPGNGLGSTNGGCHP